MLMAWKGAVPWTMLSSATFLIHTTSALLSPTTTAGPCPRYASIANHAAVDDFTIDRYVGPTGESVWFEIASHRIPLVEDNISCTKYRVAYNASTAAKHAWADAISFKQGSPTGGGATIATPFFEGKLSPNASEPGKLSEGCLGAAGCSKPTLLASYWVIDAVVEGAEGNAVGDARTSEPAAGAVYSDALVYSCIDILPIPGSGGQKLRQDFVYIYSRKRTMLASVRRRFLETMQRGGVRTAMIRDTNQTGCA